MEQVPLPEAITRFPDDLRRAERSPHTVRVYRTELSHLRACHDGTVGTVAIDTMRAAVARRDGRSPARAVPERWWHAPASHLKRLGQKHIQTTLRYAEQSDTVADAELRQRRRTIQRTRE